MLVHLRDISSVTPYADNPRDNAAAAESIATFGWQQPLVLDADGGVVGHTRYKAARTLGLTVVPVHVATDLTPAIATWDDGKLVAELLALQGTDVDLASIGFTADELADLLRGEPDANPGDPDAVPDPPADPVTKPGDVWLLGRHRLLCGDATNPADLATLLAGTPAGLLRTDPPYNVAYEGKTADKLTLANDALAGDDDRRFLARALAAANGVLRPGAGFYLWHADLEGLTARTACADAGLRVRQCLVWVKSAFALGRFDYHWGHEPCLYVWADGAAHTCLSDRAQATVLPFDRPAKNDVHPAMKPVDLFADLIGNSCPNGGVVLDPFAGSGTSLVAGEHTGRTAALVELDPRYCDVIVKRYEDLTGGTAERVPPADAVPAAV
ncbi:DNA modification methylase [Limnoglobus roseus]|uniref:Methyltransferase n=1 Tax=Limnoglobus roseus TaxID=2598579 RepID=A0A5C1AS45_9BACT|nr:DNA modification methylase [Limnoglobus roseus]QEL20913.1 DNA modification methylase [Limnoglobus roseus]